MQLTSPRRTRLNGVLSTRSGAQLWIQISALIFLTFSCWILIVHRISPTARALSRDTFISTSHASRPAPVVPSGLMPAHHSGAGRSRESCEPPAKPKWSWPLSLGLILALSLSASNSRVSGSSLHKASPRTLIPIAKSRVKLQAFAGGLEGCDHHGAGRYEFDPLDFCNNFPEHLPWYREAEVKHGRVAMLAYVGLVVPDFARFPDAIFHQKGTDVINAHSILLSAGFGKGPMWWLLMFCGLAEALRVWQLGVDFELLTLDTAGDYAMGEPFFQEEDELSILKTQELKHGRLAMIAVGGAITQAVSCNAHHFPFVPCSSC